MPAAENFDEFFYDYQKKAIENMFKILEYRITVEFNFPALIERTLPLKLTETCRYYSGLLHMPTGAGKTFIILGFLQKWFELDANQKTHMFDYLAKPIFSQENSRYSRTTIIDRYLIIVPKVVVFQWWLKSVEFWGEDFCAKNILVVSTQRDLAKWSGGQKIFIVSEDGVFLVRDRIGPVFFVFHDEQPNSMQMPYLHHNPYFYWAACADREDRAYYSNTFGTLGKQELENPVVRTIEERGLAEFLALPKMKVSTQYYKKHDYVNLLSNETSDWAYLSFLSIAPLTELKKILYKKLEKLRETIASKKDPTELKKLEEEASALQAKLKEDECPVCYEYIKDEHRIILECCQNPCCLSCVQNILKNDSKACPLCRGLLKKTIGSLKKASFQNPNYYASNSFLGVFSDLFAKCTSSKILIMFAHENPLSPDVFKNLFAELLQITNPEKSKLLQLAGIGNTITRFKNDPNLRVLYLNAKYCSFGLDLEFVDTVFLLGGNFIPTTIFDQLIGRVQRNKRVAPLRVFKLVCGAAKRKRIDDDGL